MKIIQLLSLLVMFVFISACRKDIVEDPADNYVKPTAYFPAHPGSWWKYNVNDGTELIYEIDSVAHNIKNEYLPYFKNMDCYIQGNDFYHSAYYGLGQSGYQNAPIIQTEFDTTEYQSYNTASFAYLSYVEYIDGFQSAIYIRQLFAIDTSVSTLAGQTFDNVLVMKESFVNDQSKHYLEYFVKGVGLVKRDYVNTADTVALEILTLDDYFINN